MIPLVGRMWTVRHLSDIYLDLLVVFADVEDAQYQNMLQTELEKIL
jgi:hypothetical protein